MPYHTRNHDVNALFRGEDNRKWSIVHYNITHIVVDVNEIERDHVDIRAINALAYRVASNGRCVALWPSGYSSSK